MRASRWIPSRWYTHSFSAIQRRRPGYGNRLKISRRNRRSPNGRVTCRSTCGRAASISLSYCTPDGQAVTHAMHPRQVSKCRAKSAVIGALPSSATFIR